MSNVPKSATKYLKVTAIVLEQDIMYEFSNYYLKVVLLDVKEQSCIRF